MVDLNNDTGDSNPFFVRLQGVPGETCGSAVALANPPVRGLSAFAVEGPLAMSALEATFSIPDEACLPPRTRGPATAYLFKLGPAVGRYGRTSTLGLWLVAKKQHAYACFAANKMKYGA